VPACECGRGGAYEALELLELGPPDRPLYGEGGAIPWPP